MAASGPGPSQAPELAKAAAPAVSTSTASPAMAPPPPPPPPRPASSSTRPSQSHPKLEFLPRPSSSANTPAPTSPSHAFLRPSKRIHDGPDVARFLVSKAYRDIGLFVMQLNHALCPRRKAGSAAAGTGGGLATASTTTLFTLQSPKRSNDPPSVQRLQALLARITGIIDEAPPDPGPRRFGNASFRTWHKLLAERVENGLLEEYITIEGYGSLEKTTTTTMENDGKDDATDDNASERPVSAMDEVKAYFLGSFGSAQRLDYGTGHELSFLAFLGCLWKLRVFADDASVAVDDDGEAVERSLVFGALEPYLVAVRKLILTYTLEPAGSHGVWGLDDHSFLPYVFGSAQLTRPIDAAATEPMPQEGSAPRAPKPADIVKPATVEVQRQLNLYFSAVGFINDVKRGPFWEHSPILYDVSGIKDGWGKINKGMIKMFNAEVLSKFPVVQHFEFGSLFSWDEDPAAAVPVPTMHMTNQPVASAAISAATRDPSTLASMPPPGIAAAPWAQATRMPGAGGAGGLPGPGIPYSRVTTGGPGATARPGGAGARPPVATFPFQTSSTKQTPSGGDASSSDTVVTKAPWAK
ncbi:Serine/threonine-protein phosphatase 2A activator 1 [Sporothrix curviconia]|uniref:Serine/threonine-protein phosphatase 2A activator n=1 Tax=Sporothrix curviconia TaxID=1260050 RepID=A0ABP0AVM1_9PEZI